VRSRAVACRAATDTVYGIGADAFDGTAVAALLAAKGRGRDMRSPCSSGRGTPSTACVLGARRRKGTRPGVLAGALSLVVRQAPSLQWDLGDAYGTVMLRMPLHPIAIELLREVGPMAVASANISAGRRRHRRRRPRATRRPGRGYLEAARR